MCACASTPPAKPVSAEKCSPLCKGPCEALPDWDGTYDSAPDTLGSTRAAYGRCDTKHEACLDCLDRLDRANVIDWSTE